MNLQHRIKFVTGREVEIWVIYGLLHSIDLKYRCVLTRTKALGIVVPMRSGFEPELASALIGECGAPGPRKVVIDYQGKTPARQRQKLKNLR